MEVYVNKYMTKIKYLGIISMCFLMTGCSDATIAHNIKDQIARCLSYIAFAIIIYAFFTSK